MAVWFTPVVQNLRVELTALASEYTDLEKLTADEIQPLDATALDSAEMEQPNQSIVIAPSESFSETLSNELASNTTIDLGDTQRWRQRRQRSGRRGGAQVAGQSAVVRRRLDV